MNDSVRFEAEPQRVLAQASRPVETLAPAADVFALRAERLQALAAGHVQRDWLLWLARLFAAQQQAADCLSLAMPADAEFRSGLQTVGWHAALDRALPGVYQTLCAAMQEAPLDSATLRERVAAAFAHARGADNQASSAADFVVAAAVQVAATAAARAVLEQAAGESPATGAACPCCGSLAHAGLVLAGAGKGGLRYLECAVCATRWNAVRARCTLCDEGERVQYLSLEGQGDAVRAEACDACGGYLKIFFQEHDIQVQPLADDLATLALDVLVGEAGYGRGAPNLFLSGAEFAG